MRAEDLHDRVVLDTGKQPDDVLVRGSVHAVTLAHGPFARNQDFYQLALTECRCDSPTPASISPTIAG
jgi:hypothetical protein